MKELKLDKIPERGTSDPSYDILSGGYYSGKNFSSDKETQLTIDNAIKTLNKLVAVLEENDLIF